MLVLHNHWHQLGWSNAKVGPDAEFRIVGSEPFAEIINNDEGIPTSHGKRHSSSEIINVVLCKEPKQRHSFHFPHEMVLIIEICQ
jgi:hypothetical protein